MREHLVVVGERQRGADDLAGVDALGDESPVLFEERPQVLGVVARTAHSSVSGTAAQLRSQAAL